MNNEKTAQEAIDSINTFANWLVEFITIFSNFLEKMKEAFGNLSAE